MALPVAVEVSDVDERCQSRDSLLQTGCIVETRKSLGCLARSECYQCLTDVVVNEEAPVLSGDAGMALGAGSMEYRQAKS